MLNLAFFFLKQSLKGGTEITRKILLRVSDRQSFALVSFYGEDDKDD